MDGEKERDVVWSETVTFVVGLDWVGLDVCAVGSTFGSFIEHMVSISIDSVSLISDGRSLLLFERQKKERWRCPVQSRPLETSRSV